MFGFFHALYRMLRRVPIMGFVLNFILRTVRSAFWAYRPAGAGDTAAPEEFVSFILDNLADVGPSFTLIEVGCGDGRVLRRLAREFPYAQFVGIDIQKSATREGKKINAQQGLKNINLTCASCLSEDVPWDCDVLISRTALIYLNAKDIERFLGRRLPVVHRKVLLEEIVSLTGKTECSHFFAHPISELIGQLGSKEFAVSIKHLEHVPWKKERCWVGAEVCAVRVK